jgi:tetratricopeptide (TPR) repeat protein
LKGEQDKAIADCAEAIRLDPKLAEAYYNRGFSYAEKGEYNKAIADYTEAIQLDPTTPNEADELLCRGLSPNPPLPGPERQ